MSSPLGLARCEMALRGVDYPVGSFEERLAGIGYSHQQNVHFLTTLAIINAIMHVGSNITAALSGGGGGKKESLTKSIDALMNCMFPHLEEDTQKRALEVKAMFERELNKGPIKIKAMNRDPKNKGRVTLRGKQNGDASGL